MPCSEGKGPRCILCITGETLIQMGERINE